MEKDKQTPEQEAAAKAKQEATAKAKAEQEAAAKAKAKSPVKLLVEKYREVYPQCSTFYVTSDMQVFLHDSRNAAVLHQNTLKEGELTTVTI